MKEGLFEYSASQKPLWLISALLVLNDEWTGNPKFEPPDLKVLSHAFLCFWQG